MRQAKRLSGWTWMWIVCAIALAAIQTAAQAGDLSFVVTTDKPDAIYQHGEPITFNIQLMDGGQPAIGKQLRWQRRGDDGKEQTGQFVTQAQPRQVVTSLDQPGFVRLTVTLCGDDGKPVKNAQGKNIEFDGGAGVEPEKLKTIAEPEDFDAFWQKQKQRLAEVPMKFTLTPIQLKNPNLIGFDVKIDCAGGKPVSGYLVKPKQAAPGSLMAMVSFHGYGVDGARPNEKENMLTLDINAHGIDNGQTAEYYQKLKAGELNRYGFSGNDTPENSYFLGMYLRLMRAMEFVKAQPEWDGRNLIVTGGSQGGMQSLAAAGLDGQVTFCMVSKPWCCDLGGITLGRQRGWRPDYTPAMGYFDPANHAKRIKGYVLVGSGLGDYTCPPSGITAMYNNLDPDRRTLVYIQGATHMYNPPGSRSEWSKYGECFQKAKK